MFQSIMSTIDRIDIWIQELHDMYRAQDDARLTDAHRMRTAAAELKRLWRSTPDAAKLSPEERAAFSHRVREQVNTIIGFSHPETLGMYDAPVTARERLYYQDIHKLGKQILKAVTDYLGA
jgi:hypothetical protein